MHLIGSLASPFVHRCLIVARAKGHDIAVSPPPGGSMHSEEFQAVSPMGRIPVLALDDGSHICESTAIVAYLDEVLDGPALLPAAPAARARLREIETIAIGELAAGLRPVIVHRIFRVSQNEPRVAAGIEQADRGCAALARLMADTTLPGETITRADAALTPFTALLTIIADQPEITDLLARHGFLSGYRERADRYPLLARTQSEMKEGFAAIRARLAQAAAAG
ncbi:MAG TPA: glutathione S-transferase family protein [Sphingobium sp.]|nr:glutathione S-transferase family protein [Sphingobium sp.]